MFIYYKLWCYSILNFYKFWFVHYCIEKEVCQVLFDLGIFVKRIKKNRCLDMFYSFLDLLALCFFTSFFFLRMRMTYNNEIFWIFLECRMVFNLVGKLLQTYVVLKILIVIVYLEIFIDIIYFDFWLLK